MPTRASVTLASEPTEKMIAEETEPEVKGIKMEEVEKHSSVDDLWLVIDGASRLARSNSRRTLRRDPAARAPMHARSVALAAARVLGRRPELVVLPDQQVLLIDLARLAAERARLDDVLGGDIRGKATERKTAEDVATEATAPVTSNSSSSSEGEEEDAMSFFEKLAND